MVSCRDAGFFLVPDANDVSNGTLLFISILVKRLNSSNVSGMLLRILRNRPPESNVDKCGSNKMHPLWCNCIVIAVVHYMPSIWYREKPVILDMCR